jgi:hypothetical protein
MFNIFGLSCEIKSSIKKANLFLVRRKLSELFQQINQEAKYTGEKAYFKEEFVEGWNCFASNPCYKTAIAWFEKSPDYITMLHEYFQSGNPGGAFYKEGCKFVKDFYIDTYSLKTSIDSLQCVEELAPKEYLYFNKTFKNENIYHIMPAYYSGKKWEMLASIVDNNIFKIAATLELNNQNVAIQTLQQVLANCENILGTPTEEKQGFFIWDKIDGNVILQIDFVADSAAINIYITSNNINSALI